MTRRCDARSLEWQGRDEVISNRSEKSPKKHTRRSRIRFLCSFMLLEDRLLNTQTGKKEDLVTLATRSLMSMEFALLQFSQIPLARDYFSHIAGKVARSGITVVGVFCHRFANHLLPDRRGIIFYLPNIGDR